MSATDAIKKSKKKKLLDNTEDCVRKSKYNNKRSVAIAEDQCDEMEKESSFKLCSEDEDLEHNNDKNNVNEETDHTWTNEDYIELIRRMEAQIPKADSKSFNNRAENLDWNQIQFGPHSVEECHEKWMVLRGKVRHFRLLGEVLQDAKSWLQHPWTAPLSKKKVRHPDQPTRPLSSFMLFYMDKKEKVRKKHPDLKWTEISRIVGEKYKTLSEEKKAEYKGKARQMQDDYKQNLANFYKKYPEQMPVSKKQIAKSNRPLPPFKLFLKSKLLKHENDEDFNLVEFSEKYKELWKNLSFKKKASWIRIAKEEEQKFLEKVDEGLMDDRENRPTTSYRSVISKEEYAVLDRLAGKPEKPPNSAYSLFSKLMLQGKDQNHVDGEPKNRMKEIANKWKELPDELKKEYAERVKHMHETYKLEFANYLENLPEEKKAEEMAKIQPKKKAKQKSTKRGLTEITTNKESLYKHEPEKPPVTAWDLFKNEFIMKNSHLSSKIAFTQAAEMWKNLSQKDIQKYKKKHEHLKNKYMTDYQAFLKSLSEEELKQYSKMKKEHEKQTVDEESIEEESSSLEEQQNNMSSSTSSDESDSGVSEEEEF